MTWLPILALAGAIGLVILIAMRSARKAAAQRRAHEFRLQAMVRAATAAATRKASGEAGLATGGPGSGDAPVLSEPPAREERECPFCAERILKKARVCKHCRRDVEPLV